MVEQMQDANMASHVLATTFNSKYSSKKETYKFLRMKVKIYLPDVECVTIWYMREIV